MTRLRAQGISLQFGEKPTLDDVSFDLEVGEFATLIGPNGSGKSTLLKVVAGILPLQGRGASGQVRLGERDFLALDPRARARAVAYVGAELRADFPLTAMETVSLGRICHGAGSLSPLSSLDEELIHQAMERCLCWELRDRDIATLSGGERQLVALARALAQGATILLLDEALSRMDLHHQARVGAMLRGLVREHGYAVMLVSHDVNLAAEWASTAILLKGGRKVAAGSLGETLTEARLTELYPDSAIGVGRNPFTGSTMVHFRGI